MGEKRRSEEGEGYFGKTKIGEPTRRMDRVGKWKENLFREPRAPRHPNNKLTEIKRFSDVFLGLLDDVADPVHEIFSY